VTFQINKKKDTFFLAKMNGLIPEVITKQPIDKLIEDTWYDLILRMENDSIFVNFGGKSLLNK